MMTKISRLIQETKDRLARPASRAVIGGFRPPTNPFTSWFGSVRVSHQDEDWPEWNGQPMLPLCQFNLTEAPFVPDELKDLALICVFLNREELPIDRPNGEQWVLRSYSSLDGLRPITSPDERGFSKFLKPFPIRWELIEEDYPNWEDAEGLNVPPELDDTYYDHFENISGTKLGGWPSLIQHGLGMATTDPGTERYAFQIGSEEKSGWMWGDNGTGYFGRSVGAEANIWTLEWQCF